MKRKIYSPWEIELKKMTKLVRNILGRFIPVREVPEGCNEVGYTSAKPEICLAKEHPIMDGLNEKEKEVFRMGVLAHEMLHQIFSDFEILEKEASQFETNIEQNVFCTLFNLVEDCNIEYYASTVMGGILLKALRFQISYIYKKSKPVSESKSAFCQLLNALVMFGDKGIIKGDFTFPEAREAFVKCAPVFNEGVKAKAAAGRCECAKKMMEISKPLWEADKRSEEEIREMMKALEKLGRNMPGHNSSSLSSRKEKAADEKAPSSSPTSDRRDDFVEKISKALTKEAEGSGSSLTGADEMPLDDSASKASKSEPGASDEKDFESSEKKKIDDIMKSIEKGNDELLDDVEDTIELTEDDIRTMESLSKDAEKDLERESEESDFGEIDLTVTPSLYDNTYSVYNGNVVIAPNQKDRFEANYNVILQTFGAAINAFAKKMERLFKNDVDTKEHKKSGKLNVKRYAGSKVTTRIFDKSSSPREIDDLSVFILVDESGSMGQMCVPTKSRYMIARDTAISLSEAFARLNIPLYVMGFSGEERRDVDHYHYIKWKNTKSARLSLLSIAPKCQNFDAMSINIAHQMLKKRHSLHKLLIVISDGVPYCSLRDKSKLFVETKDEIRRTRKDGIDVLGIAIGNSDTDKLQALYGKNFFHTDSVDYIFTGVTKEITKIVQSW